MKTTIRFRRWMLMATGAATLLACDDDPVNPSAKSRTELLTTSSWKRTALVSNPAYAWYPGGTVATDVLGYMLPCEKDNFEVYGANGIVVTNEGPTKCDPSDPQTWTATWSLIANDTKILIDGVDEYTIDELTETTLKLRSTFTEDGVTYTHFESYGH